MRASSESVPAPDGGVVTNRDQDAAVPAEAGLSDGRGAPGQGEGGAPKHNSVHRSVKNEVIAAINVTVLWINCTFCCLRTGVGKTVALKPYLAP